MLAHGFRVGTASGKYFSSWVASGKSTTPLQLHVDLQIPGSSVAGWNTLPGVTPLQWPNWGNSMGRNWGSLSFEGLGTPVAQEVTVCPCHVLPSVELRRAGAFGAQFLKHTLIYFTNSL